MLKKELKIRNQKAFTLIELLVVIAIIGILAALIIANLSTARARARDTQRKAHLQQIATALQMYFDVNNNYPNTSINLSPNVTYYLCNSGFTTTSCSGAYAQFTPPVGSSYSYTYYLNNNIPSFRISVQLETVPKNFVCTPNGCREE